MIYDLKYDFKKQQIIEKLKYFIKNEKVVELKLVTKKKTISTNNYFHLIVSWFAFEYGEDAKYIKEEIIKKIVCEDIFKYEYVNKKTGECRDAYRSWSDLNQQESNIVIEKFRNYSSKEAGIYLPEPSDLATLNQIEIELKNNQIYT